jgi:hypothetical protein
MVLAFCESKPHRQTLTMNQQFYAEFDLPGVKSFSEGMKILWARQSHKIILDLCLKLILVVYYLHQFEF